MHLIYPLISGVRGAENGTVDVYKRGTKVAARTYTGFEGDGAQDLDSRYSLDANGGIELYVNEMVDVVVTSASGTKIREFVAGSNISGIEVLSTGFTGTDYADGASGTNKPVTLKSVMDLWLTNAGAPDWKVKAGGVTKTLVQWFGAVYGLFYNVKDPDYGAVGDGTTDDTSAIQAAITAATANGGIVFFPPGSYIVTSKIDLPAKVSLWGCGPNASVIRINHATNATIDVAGSSTGREFHEIMGLTLDAAQSNTGNVITMTGNVHVRVENCQFGQPVATNGNTKGVCIKEAGSPTAGKIVVRDCKFYMATQTLQAIYLPDAQTEVFVEGCEFVPNADYAGNMIEASGLRVSNCDFRNAVITTSTLSAFVDIKVLNGADSWVRGCYFDQVGAGGIVCECLYIETDSGSKFIESENHFEISGAGITNPVVPYNIATGTVAKHVRLFTRELLGAVLLDNSSTVNISADQFGYVEWRTTSNTSTRTIVLSGNIPLFSKFILCMHHDGAPGTVTVTFDSSTAKPAGTYAMSSSGKKYYTMFVGAEDTGAANKWHESHRGSNVTA